MASPNDRRYSDSHEWHMAQGGLVVVGITRFAVDQLTDVTFAEFKPVGTRLAPGDSLGEVESVKTTSDVYAHVAGEIAEVNAEVTANPGILNDDPYGRGWLVKIKAQDTAPLNKLMDAQAYDAGHGG